MITKSINQFLKKWNYKISKDYTESELLADPVFADFLKRCQPYTMTSIERMHTVYTSANYVSKNKIAGDYVECGVWRGGSSMMAILTFLHNKDTSREIYLYDTYEGMSEPSKDDVDVNGKTAKVLLETEDKFAGNNNWCFATLEDVKNNILKLGYPADKIHFVQGKVEESIPATIPTEISLLRLDTDWYESTKHEMEYLYPLLKEKGVLILDDYGHWQGAKKAVDEYLLQHGITLMLNKIDYSGRVAIK
ncbi:TylF/MycF/NovP-related O-methyltransferase [Dyadobacter tibetensis]|uniref:TylF/MycF/NovP-related O-methyltransferase n=1 Tax=Dyadobacter tibetensis TaxID=1211851 RepID=UPI00046ECFC8|nr:TylF/MycF/NovP-related O-methyltransferase [Dyadobacter tibetensis]